MENKEEVYKQVAEMIEHARQVLKSAKVIADEHNISFCLQDVYEDVTGEYVDWYSSTC
jgi:hypothetical protein